MPQQSLLLDHTSQMGVEAIRVNIFYICTEVITYTKRGFLHPHYKSDILLSHGPLFRKTRTLLVTFTLFSEIKSRFPAERRNVRPSNNQFSY